jgi:hypothetical protein
VVICTRRVKKCPHFATVKLILDQIRGQHGYESSGQRVWMEDVRGHSLYAGWHL